ncbi:MAG: hypothetical protein H0V53_07290 [Rubrobacter sp.]|nr:hypothetical protein [Rubrobacter sp.]
MDAATIAQIASSATNVLLVLVFGVGYYYIYRVSQKSLEEMRQDRVSGGRPQVIIEADYRRLPEIDLVVRNVGGGPAKDIEFDFSSTIKSSTGFVLSDLFYLKNGMDFLGPGGEIRCLWDDLESLEGVMKEEGLLDGIRVTARYQDLSGSYFENSWKMNPLLYEGIRNADRKDMEDLVLAVEKLSPEEAEPDGQRSESSEEYEQAEEESESSYGESTNESRN